MCVCTCGRGTSRRFIAADCVDDGVQSQRQVARTLRLPRTVRTVHSGCSRGFRRRCQGDAARPHHSTRTDRCVTRLFAKARALDLKCSCLVWSRKIVTIKQTKHIQRWWLWHSSAMRKISLTNSWTHTRHIQCTESKVQKRNVNYM